MNTKRLDTGSRDAISLLPDEILGDILSLLPTKLAASTSVLSKKWRNVFRLVPDFNFAGYVSVYPENGEPERGESLRKFLERTQSDSSPIKKFSLKREIRYASEMAFVSSWICDAVEHGVLEVEFRTQLRTNHYFERPLPSQLLTNKTLVKLTLGTYRSPGKNVSYVALDLPSYVSLPSLKILFVDTVFFPFRGLSDVLLAGCPVLEELTIYHNDEAVPHTIRSPSVKRLSLDYISSWEFDVGYHLSLDLPNLMYLDYSGFALSEYLQANLDSLVEAKLDLHLLQDSKPDITKLIAGISNVQILHLSRDSVHVIYMCIKQIQFTLHLPMFNNLVNLSFGSKNKQDWKVLAYLLNQSPKLETLIIQDLNGYTGGISMPSNKVKGLEILGYRGTVEESNQLKSFLAKFKCLKLFQVRITEQDKGRILQIKSDIMMLHGGSLGGKCEFRVLL